MPGGGSTAGLSTGSSWGAWWFEDMIRGQGGQHSDPWEVTLDTPEGVPDGASFEVCTAFLPDGPAGSGTLTGDTGRTISASRSPGEQTAAAILFDSLTSTGSTWYFSRSTGYMPLRTSTVASLAVQAVYAETPQVRTAVDQLADRARSQDRIRVFVPGADAIFDEGIEQIVLEGRAPADTIDPQIETAYRENVEPSL